MGRRRRRRRHSPLHFLSVGKGNGRPEDAEVRQTWGARSLCPQDLDLNFPDAPRQTPR